MKRNVVATFLATVLAAGGILVVACSSSDTGTSSGSSGTASSSSGASSGTSSGASSGTSGTSDAGSEGGGGGYGTKCTTAGGADPACTGTYNLCEAVGTDIICTKGCTKGGPGGVADPDECPSPPTTGLCTPKNFCK